MTRYYCTFDYFNLVLITVTTLCHIMYLSMEEFNSHGSYSQTNSLLLRSVQGLFYLFRIVLQWSKNTIISATCLVNYFMDTIY